MERKGGSLFSYLRGDAGFQLCASVVMGAEQTLGNKIVTYVFHSLTIFYYLLPPSETGTRVYSTYHIVHSA